MVYHCLFHLNIVSCHIPSVLLYIYMYTCLLICQRQAVVNNVSPRFRQKVGFLCPSCHFALFMCVSMSYHLFLCYES